jgi:hypothetical protein
VVGDAGLLSSQLELLVRSGKVDSVVNFLQFVQMFRLTSAEAGALGRGREHGKIRRGVRQRTSAAAIVRGPGVCRTVDNPLEVQVLADAALSILYDHVLV